MAPAAAASVPGVAPRIAIVQGEGADTRNAPVSSAALATAERGLVSQHTLGAPNPSGAERAAASRARADSVPAAAAPAVASGPRRPPSTPGPAPRVESARDDMLDLFGDPK
jgi:hypothetical protein